MDCKTEVWKVAIERAMDSEQLKKGWSQVQEGVKCLYPDCDKKSYSAAFHGVPLCREHFDLAQFTSFVIFKSCQESAP